MQKLGYSLATVGALSLSYASTMFAQATEGSFGGPLPDVADLPDAADANDVRDVIGEILSAVLNFLALVAVVIIVIAGIRLIVSQGEDEQKDKAKKTIFYALIGLVIVLFAKVIVSVITVYLAETVRN